MQTLTINTNQNIFDYLLTNKGQITDLLSFLDEQNIDYDDFNNLPYKIYDTYISNDVTKYYVRKGITVVSENLDFEDSNSFTNNITTIQSDNIKQITKYIYDNRLYRYNEQNIFDYLLTNKGQITDLLSFLNEQMIDYDDFTLLENKIYDNSVYNKTTQYYLKNKIVVVSTDNAFNTPNIYPGFSFGFSIGFNA